jgi:hypothetical protein
MNEQPTPTQSAETCAIVAALAKAQGAFLPVRRNRTVEVRLKDGTGKYTFTYATLDSVLDATRKALSDNGICHTATVADGVITVTLRHESGQWFGSSLPVPSPSQGWQPFGSATTYARRYLLSPLLGVASEEDDDGNVADGNSAHPVDPLQPLWDAMAKTDIRGNDAIRVWCEKVLGRPVPTPDTIFPKDMAALLAALEAPKAPPATFLAGAKELNAALDKLAPWGSACDGLPAKAASDLKKAAKLAWANGILRLPVPVSAFAQLKPEQVTVLIAAATNGEMPETADDMPAWANDMPAWANEGKKTTP